MVHDPRVSSQLARLSGIYRDPARVDRDASTLLKSSVGMHLNPIIAVMVENNGDSSNVLVLQGTIATMFRGNTYQLLMDIYLPAGYPNRPPVAFVRLARNMYLKENHRHVGDDGKVYLPYLHEWNRHTHNLVELVVAMSSVFSADPPVFTRAASPPPPPPPPPPPRQDASMMRSTDSEREAILLAEIAQANEAAEAARRAEQEEEEERRRQERVAREEAKRLDAVAAQKKYEEERLQQVKQQVQAKIQQHLNTLSKDVQQRAQADAKDTQRLTVAQEQKIDKQIDLYSSQKSELERQLSTAEQRIQEITEWLKEEKMHNSTTSSKNRLSADDTAQPASTLQSQMLFLSTENHAISDALYFLDKALYRGYMNCETHLKQVRRLAKKQFLVRAHLIKIHQAMMLGKRDGQRGNGVAYF